MRRSLVLTDEAARHPFLASLPAHVRKVEAPRAVTQARHGWLTDLRDFLATYCACFVAVSLYIA
ncbi:MAG: hypothetical protein U1E37_12840 [Sphingomonadaceae bacterium]